jgi:hypothetical protein
MRLCSRDLILYTGQNAKFSLYGYVKLVSVIHNLLGEGDVLLIREGRSVDHHGAEAKVYAALAGFKAVTVIQVEADLGFLPTQFLCIFHGAFCHIAEKGLVGVVTCSLGDLEDNGALGLCSGLDDGLKLLHIVEIECGDGVTAGNGLLEHLTGVHKTQFFVRYHS